MAYFDELPERVQRQLCDVMSSAQPYVDSLARRQGVTPRNVVQALSATAYSRGVTGAGRGRPASFRVTYEASLNIGPHGKQTPAWSEFTRLSRFRGEAYYPDLEAILQEKCDEYVVSNDYASESSGLDLSTLRRSKSNIYSRGVMGCNCTGMLPDGRHLWLRIDIVKAR